MSNPTIIGNATLYHGDCREILPTLQEFDLLLTDPPYGIGEAAGKNKSRGSNRIPPGTKNTKQSIANSAASDFGTQEWDNKTVPSFLILAARRLAKYQIIFGGNYYDLPPTSCWLIWDKDNDKSDFADCEMAWTNLRKATRLKRWRWNGMLQERMGSAKEKRVYPCQKPVPVMEWCLTHVPEAKTVIDPFMGSGTTGIACFNFGLSFVGIEKTQKGFDIACHRIEDAQRQQRLFA